LFGGAASAASTINIDGEADFEPNGCYRRQRTTAFA
jgi:hypothetical protein